MSRLYRSILGTLLTILALDCSDDTAPTISGELRIVSGNHERGPIGGTLPIPLRVRVVGSDTLPLEGVLVQWSVMGGQATLDPMQDSTNAAGEAETHVALGEIPGEVVVRASVENLTPVDFSITAVDPSVLLTFIAVSAGGSHTCGVTDAGAAYCWGENPFGQLGDGTTTQRLTPAPVAGGLSFVEVSALGARHTCGLTAGGAAYCWGQNMFGQLGDGTMTPRLTPVPVAGGLSFVALTAGALHTCGVTTAGAAYCWGGNTNGQLGDEPTAPSERLTPSLVAGGLTFASLSARMFYTCGVTVEGAAYCWGDNQDGQLGDGTTDQRLTPVPVAGGLSFTSISAGGIHTCGLTAAGVAYCWGRNPAGQLGDGTTTERFIPVPVVGEVSFTAVSAGGSATCGLAAAGAAYCWGDNRLGQLGDGTTAQRLTPGPVAGELSFTELSAGGSHSCGVAATTGSAYCWGSNRFGALGDGTTTDRSTPTVVTE
jgi:alpha-tubulin suppressor-like RCC1 family protein